MPPERQVTSQLPLKPNVFLVLLAMADGETHGYAINKDVQARSGGKVKLDPGTLYRLIGRLLEDGLVEESSRRADRGLGDDRRRYYRLTDLGRGTLRAESERMAGLVDAVRSKNLFPAG